MRCVEWVADELTIPGVAERAAHAYAGDDALVDGEAVVRYSTLWFLARVGAAALVDRGVQPGDRVALLADNSPAWAIANLAILCTGAAVVPLSTRWRTAEFDDVLGRADCRVVLGPDDVDALPATRASAPARTEVERRLRALTPSSATKKADVVLPSPVWPESERECLTLDGIAKSTSRLIKPPHGTRSDAEILREISKQMNKQQSRTGRSG